MAKEINLGSVYATFELRMKDFERGITNAQKQVDDLAKNVERSGIRAFQSLDKNAANATKGIDKSLQVTRRQVATMSSDVQRDGARGFAALQNSGVTSFAALSKNAAQSTTNISRSLGSIATTKVFANIQNDAARSFGNASNSASNASSIMQRALASIQDAASRTGAAIQRSMGAGFQSAAKQANDALQSVNNNINWLVKSAASIGVTGSFGLVAMGKAGFDAVAGVQASVAGIQALTDTSEDASRALNDMLNYVKGRPFDRLDAIGASRQLLVFGRSVDEVRKDIDLMGRAVLLSGKGSLTELSQVYGQVMASGRLMTGEFNYMQAAGVRLGKVLTEKLGVSMEDLYKKLAAGEISAAQFREAMEEALPEDIYEKSSNLINNRLLSLRASFRDLGFSLLGVDFTKLDAEGRPLVEKGGLLDVMQDSIEELTAALRSPEMQESIANIGKRLAELGTEYLPKVVEGMEWFLENLPELSQRFMTFVKVLLAIKGIAFVVNTVTTLSKAFSGVSKAIKTVSGPIGKFGKLIGGLLTGGGGGGLSGFLSVLGGIGRAALTAGQFLLRFAGHIGIIIGVITAVITAGKWLIDNWEDVKQTASDVGTNIKNFFEGLPQFFEELWNGITAFFSDAWENITTTVENAWNSIVNFFLTLPQRAWDMVNGIAYGLGFLVGRFILFVTEDVPNFINDVVEWFAKLPERIWNFLTELWNGAVEIWNNFWNSVKEIAAGIFWSVVDWFIQLPGRVWQLLVDLWNRAVEVFNWIKNDLPRIAGEAINNVVEWFKGLPEKVAHWAQDTWQKVTDKFREIRDAMGEFIQQGVDNVVEFFRDMPRRIGEALGGLAGWIGSKMQEIGRSATRGMEDGLDRHSPSAIERMFFDIRDNSIAAVAETEKQIAKLSRATFRYNQIKPNDFSDTNITHRLDGIEGSAIGGGDTYNIGTIELPNVQNPQDFARQFKLAVKGVRA